MIILPYKHRWGYAIVLQLVLLIGGAFFVLKPSYSQLTQLQKELVEAEREFSLLRSGWRDQVAPQRLMPATRPKTKVEIIADLADLANVNGLNLQKMQRLVSEDTSEDTFSLHVQLDFIGGYQQLLAFIQALAQSQYFITLKAFNFSKFDEAHLSHYVSDQYQLMLELLIAQRPTRMRGLQYIKGDPAQKKPSMQWPMKIASPFCLPNHFYAPADNFIQSSLTSIHLSQYSIKQFKVVGGFSQNNNLFALVALPNHQLQIVKLHQQIGREQGRIESIDAYHMQIKLPNGSFTEILMQ